MFLSRSSRSSPDPAITLRKRNGRMTVTIDGLTLTPDIESAIRAAELGLDYVSIFPTTSSQYRLAEDTAMRGIHQAVAASGQGVELGDPYYHTSQPVFGQMPAPILVPVFPAYIIQGAYGSVPLDRYDHLPRQIQEARLSQSVRPHGTERRGTVNNDRDTVPERRTTGTTSHGRSRTHTLTTERSRRESQTSRPATELKSVKQETFHRTESRSTMPPPYKESVQSSSGGKKTSGPGSYYEGATLPPPLSTRHNKK